MEIDQLSDRRLRALAQAFRLNSRELGRLLEEMVDAPLERKLTLYNQISRKVTQLQETSTQWAAKHLPQFFEEADEKILKLLRRGNAPIGDVASARAALERLSVEFSERVNQALFSVGATASRLLRTNDSATVLNLRARQTIANAGVKAIQVREKALKDLRTQLRDHPVALLAKGARTIHYGLDYYVAMVASNAMVRAQNLPALARAETTTDLVRVSNNPSMHGDFCDYYAGKVFSVSGAHPIFPSIALTPNGGPPYHPQCVHTLRPVLPNENLTQEEIVPPSRLLEAGEDITKFPKTKRSTRR